MARDYKAIVTALLLKAESTEFEAEREELETKAFALMSEHSITVALEKEVTDKQVMRKMLFKNPYSNQKWILYCVLADHFNSKAIRGCGGIVYFFGYESDFQSTEFLYSILINQVMINLSGVKIPGGVNAKSYKVSWWAGFNSRIAARLKESKKTATANAVPGAAVALYDRSRASETEMRKKFPHVKSLRTTANSLDGWYSGQDAGERANFHNQSTVDSNGRRALT